MLLERSLSPPLPLSKELDGELDQVKTIGKVRAQIGDLLEVVRHFLTAKLGSTAAVFASTLGLRVAVCLGVGVRSVVQVEAVQPKVFGALNYVGRLVGLLDLVQAVHLRQVTTGAAILFEEALSHFLQ